MKRMDFARATLAAAVAALAIGAAHAQQKPAAKPAFIQNTSMAATSTQTVSMPTRSVLNAAGSILGAAV